MQKIIKEFFFIIFVFLVNCYNLTAQGQMQNLYYENNFRILDTASYEILYELEFVEDTLNPKDKLFDKQLLQVGINYSNYFSDLLFKNDSVNTLLQEQDADNFHSIPKGAAEYHVIRNRKNHTFTVTYRSDDIIFKYTEKVPLIKWEIQSEKKTIHQYTCQRATAIFRGREYEAWFSTEIPIHEGPYKFGQLPGLILELSDLKKQYIFKCIKIMELKTPTLIKIRNWPYSETTREELKDFLVNKYKNIAGYYKLKGVNLWIKKDGQFIHAPENYSVPFNPIELE